MISKKILICRAPALFPSAYSAPPRVYLFGSALRTEGTLMIFT